MDDLFRRILVPLDGSPAAESVLPVLEMLASRTGADVLLLHALERGAKDQIHGERHLTERQEAEEYLENIAGSLASAGIRARTHVHPNEVGDVAVSILEHVEESSADLIMLCSHGWGGLREVIFGSIAQQVLKSGTCPVFLIPSQIAVHGKVFALSDILLPVDIQHRHDEALDLALAVARLLKGDLHLLCVVPEPGDLKGAAWLSSRYLFSAGREVLAMAEEGARKYLNELKEKCLSAGVNAESTVARGDAAEEITRHAAANDIDLLILPGHGRTGIDALLSRSTGSRVVARIDCPILMLRVTSSV